MADVKLISRLVNGLQRNIDLSTNTLVVGNIKIGGDTNHATFDVSALTAARTITMPDTAVNLGQIATNASNLSAHLDGGASKHDATEVDYERADGSKKNILAASDDVESALSNLDDAIGDLTFVPTNYSNPTDTVSAHLQAIDTALAAAGGTSFTDSTFEIKDDSDATKKINFQVAGVATGTTRTISMPDENVDLGEISKLRTLSGTAAGDTNLSTFTGSTIADNSSVKAALQSLETAVELRALDSVVLKKDGSVAATGNLNMNTSYKIINLANPTADQDAATKAYVDSVAQGLDVHAEVNIKIDPSDLPAFTATGANATKTLTANANGAFPTVQGYTAVANVDPALASTFLIIDSPATFDDGIYYLHDAGSAGTPWVMKRRPAEDGSPSNEVKPGDFFFVSHGTSASTGWVVSSAGDLDTDGEIDIDNGDKLTVVQFSGAGTYSAGTALDLSGTTFNVKYDDSTIGVNGSNQLYVKNGGITATQLAASVAGDGISGGAGTALAVDHDGEGLTFVANQLALELDGTTLSKSASGLKVNSIADAQIASNAAITISKLASGTAAQIILANNSGVPTYTTVTGDVTISDSGVTTIGALKVTDAMLAGSISTSKLTDSATITEAKSFFDNTDISGAEAETLTNASNADSLHKHSTIIGSFAAGEGFDANTSYLVRLALSGETAGRIYKADKAAGTSGAETNTFYVIGILVPGAAKVAGNTCEVVMLGLHTLGSSDSTFAGANVGRPLYLDAVGAWTLTPSSTTNDAVFRIGQVASTNQILVVAPQLIGIN